MNKFLFFLVFGAIIIYHNSLLSQISIPEFNAPLLISTKKALPVKMPNQAAHEAVEYTSSLYQELSNTFIEFEVFSLNPQSINRYLQRSSQKSQFILNLGNDHSWNIELEPHDLRADNYQLRIDDEVLQDSWSQRSNTTTYRGKLLTPGGGEVRLSVDQQMIQGFVTLNGEKIFFENLSSIGYQDHAQELITYHQHAVAQDAPIQCGATHVHDQTQDIPEYRIEQSEACAGTQEVEIATAATYNRYVAFGQSTTAVNNHILSILNMVEANYEVFGVTFKVTEQVVFTNPNSPGWDETEPTILLNNFTSWGPTGFTQSHDIGSLFFDGKGSGTVGVAWLGSLCSRNYRYNVNDLLGSAEYNRVLVAHEFGHNFGAQHDAQGTSFIMAPSITLTNEFSSQSQNRINQLVANVGCLSCIENNNDPPVAAFTASPTQGEAPLKVDLDASAIQTYAWNFGNGQTGTGQNTSVTFNMPGTYTIFLTVTDDNNATANTSVQVTVNAANVAPTAAFTASPTQGEAPLKVDLDASTANDPDGTIQAYAWDFGNGQNGTGQTASVTYNQEGIFTITLVVTDDNGDSDTTTQQITVDKPENVAPILNNTSYSVNENTASGTLVGTLEATDSDQDQLTYALQNGNKDNAFSLDPQSGELTVRNSAALDYERNAQFSLTVTVTDNAPEPNTTEATIVVELIDQPEGKVVRNIQIGSTIINYYMSIMENSPKGTLVGSVLDNDLSNRDISFSIQGGYGKEAFTIDQNTGAIYVENPQYINYEFRKAFLLTIRIVEVYTQNGRTLRRKLTVYLRIDVNDIDEILQPEVSTLQWANSEMVEDEREDLRKALEQLVIYPNPAHSWIYLDWDAPFEGDLQIDIFDLQGRIVKRVTDYKNSQRFSSEISLDRFQSGMYLLKVNVGNQTQVKWINVVQ